MNSLSGTTSISYPAHGTLELRPSRPSRFLFLPLGYVLAHTSRCIEIAKKLRSRGHEVVFGGDNPLHPRSKLGLVKRAGFRLESAREPFHPYGWDRFVKHGWLASAMDLHNLRKWVQLEEIIESQVRLIRQEQPDLVIGDATISATTAAYIADTPAACIMNGYASRLLTPGSLYHALAVSYDWLRLAPIRRRVYRNHGVKPVNALQLLRSAPLISPDLPELYEPPAFFPRFHTVGPIWSEYPGPLPDWITELEDGTPNVYITMGSTGLLDEFLQRTYSVLGRTPYRFVVTTGGQAAEETVRRAPPNFRITRYAPGSEILKRCKALIFHGGNGTMYQSLVAGVPMISLPSHLEQDVLTGIGVDHGFCIKMRARRISPEQLVRNLNRIIQTPSYAEAARKLSESVRGSNGAAAAAELLERFAREGSPTGAQILQRYAKS